MFSAKLARTNLVVRAEDKKAVAKKKEEKPYVGPKRGALVRVLRPSSYWYKRCGKVIVCDQTGIRYPVTVRFETVNYAGVQTNNYGLEEVETITADEYRA